MENNTIQNNNEIDLLSLCKHAGQAIGKGISQLFGFIVTIIRVSMAYCIKKVWWELGFIIIGVVLALFAYNTRSHAYSSMMTLQTNVLDNTHMIDYVNELGKIQDTLIRANTLHIPDSTAKSILKIGAYYGIAVNGVFRYIDTKNSFRNNPDDSLTYRIPGKFYVQVISNNKNIFNSLGRNLVDAINTNPYAVENNKIRLRELQSQLAEIDNQLHLLDSVQGVDYFKTPDNKVSLGQLLLNTDKDQRQLYHNDILNLHDMKLSIERGLAEYNQNPVTIVHDFSPQATLDNPLSLYLKKYVLIVLLAGIALLIVIDNRKKTWKWIFQQ